MVGARRENQAASDSAPEAGIRVTEDKSSCAKVTDDRGPDDGTTRKRRNADVRDARSKPGSGRVKRAGGGGFSSVQKIRNSRLHDPFSI